MRKFATIVAATILVAAILATMAAAPHSSAQTPMPMPAVQPAPATFRLMMLAGHTKKVKAIAWSADGTLVVDPALRYRQERGEWERPGAYVRLPDPRGRTR